MRISLQFSHLPIIIIFLISQSLSPITAQQLYVRQVFNDCNNRDNSTSVLGYTCNGLTTSCQSYLTFRSNSQFNTVSSISTLLGVDPSALSQLNSAPIDATFEKDKLVLVPVNCSCSGQFYQANTSFVLGRDMTYFSIANDTFHGLTTCQSLQDQNPDFPPQSLVSGTRITVPLRCACPTKNQTDSGENYLMSYLVTWGESVDAISVMFGANSEKTLEANGLSDQDFTIYPFTTLLVPLQDPPSITQTGAPPPPPPPSSPPPSPSSDGGSSNIWAPVLGGVLGGIGVTLVIGFLVFWTLIRRKRRKTDLLIASERSFEGIEKPAAKKVIEEDPSYISESVLGIAQALKVYRIEEIRSATENFSPSCWIKGSVYRGKINGDFAAIKKMDGDVSKEINLLNKINHYNLIRLSGVCFDEGNWYLVYEYAVNGPLSEWIYHNNGDQKCLSWTQRMQIAVDVATGLNYLHSYTSPPHVHKDVKTSNVLLDSELRAKIANFALARSAEGEEGEFALTRHIVGTKGYMAPEYLEHGFVSPKLDVYAYGVLLLEMVTGKEVSELYDVNVNFSDVLNGVLEEEGDGKEKLREIMDSSLQGNYHVELAIFVARLIHRCVKKDPSQRPGMDEVVQSLSNVMNTSKNWEMSNGVMSGYRSFG